MRDPLQPLSFAAALTKNLKLGTGILILPQRHPIYVAKETATIDQLSKGRLLLGIGSGWLAEEFQALGLDFHKRGAMTDEAIDAMRALWSDGAATFHGKHYNFDTVKMYPKPFNKSGIPIIIGGHSPAAAKRAGRYGDGFFPALGDIPQAQGIVRDDGDRGAKGRPRRDTDRAVLHGTREARRAQGVRRTSASRAWSCRLPHSIRKASRAGSRKWPTR